LLLDGKIVVFSTACNEIVLICLLSVPIIPEFLYTIRHQHQNQSQLESFQTTTMPSTTWLPDYGSGDGSGDENQISGDGDYHFNGIFTCFAQWFGKLKYSKN
jgi:hypothetical protein